MAGSYPNVPSRRMAWDADGTIAWVRNVTKGAAAVEWTSNQQAELNDEDEVTAGPTGGSVNDVYELAWIFPELREIDGFFARSWSASQLGLLEASSDSTNGMDGSWTTLLADYSDPNADVYNNGEYRDAITSVASSNRRAVRIAWSPGGQANIKTAHIYGTIAAGETPDRLLWVDNDTGSEFGLPIDYGDIPRGSAEDRDVKLRNNSGSLSAGSVQVTAESLYLNSGNWYTIKESGGSFQSTLPLTSSIGSGSDSPVLTVRRVTPDSEALGLHAGRLFASVGSWS